MEVLRAVANPSTLAYLFANSPSVKDWPVRMITSRQYIVLLFAHLATCAQVKVISLMSLISGNLAVNTHILHRVDNFYGESGPGLDLITWFDVTLSVFSVIARKCFLRSDGHSGRLCCGILSGYSVLWCHSWSGPFAN